MDLPSMIQSIGLAGIGAILFAENGLLLGFFLPGDSLLFTAGFLASKHYLQLWPLLAVSFASSVIGVSVGYAFGHRFGRRLFQRQDSRFFKQENLVRTEKFYERFGAVMIIFARFIPIVRTFAPVVAGIAKMPYGIFTLYNIIGGIVWSVGVTLLGYWLGERIPNIDRVLLPIIIIVMVLSFLPGILHLFRDPIRRRGVINWVRRRK